MRNVLSKLPRLMQATMKKLVQQVFLAPTYAKARQRGRDLIAKFKDRYPAAMDCLERDLEECITYLRFPTARSCLSLLYASLITASKHWRGIPMTATTLRQLQSLRAAIAAPRKEEG